jgi:NitT/TauT family transport system permease protein
MVRWILFPAAIPEIFTGLRFFADPDRLAAGEMFVATRPGYLLMNGIGLHNVELVMSVTLLTWSSGVR